MSRAVYVKDKSGNKFIATQQMVRRIESGELVPCDPPTDEEIARIHAKQFRLQTTAPGMLQQLPEKTPVRAEPPAAPAISAIAQQIAAYEQATAGGVAALTDEAADAELAAIRAQTAALEQAVAAGQVQLVDPRTVAPGALTSGQLPAAPQVAFAPVAPQPPQTQEVAQQAPAIQAQVQLGAAPQPPVTDGNFQTAFAPAHPQAAVWGHPGT